MNLKIPFAPLPVPVLKRISNIFISPGSKFAKSMPYIEENLKQGNFEIQAEEYCSIMIFTSLLYFVFFTLLLGLLLAKIGLRGGWLLAATVGAIVAFLIALQILMYPKMIVNKKVKNIETNLIYALRTILIQIRSGVTLFDAMNTVAKGDFEELGDEFKITVEAIETGMLQDEALDKMAERNPSHYLRKALWQISNGLKAGGDVQSVIGESVSTMLREEKIGITKFGASLRLLSLMYMMIGVIMPAMGLTFLIVLGSFPNVPLDESLFWVLLISSAIMQFMYIGIIKSKRPNLMSTG